MTTDYRFLRVLLLLILVAAVAACTRRDEEDVSQSEPPVSSLSAEAEPEEEEASSQQPVQMQVTEAGRRRAAEAADEPVRPRDQAFESRRFSVSPVYPRDFSLGPIQGETTAAATVALNTLAAIRDGEEVELRATAPADENAIRLLESFFEANRHSYLRLAAPVTVGPEIYSFAFRAVAGDASIDGELVLELLDGQWYSAGIQAAPAQRASTEEFDPSAYRP